MNLDLKDKVVLITGGTGGIGGQVVADYLDEGAIVACLIRNDKKMEILHKELNKANIPTDNLHSFECDLLDFEDVKRATNAVVNKLKRSEG